MLRRVVEMGRPKQSSQEELMGVLRRKAWVLLRRMGKYVQKSMLSQAVDTASSDQEAWWMRLCRGEGPVAVLQRGIGGDDFSCARFLHVHRVTTVGKVEVLLLLLGVARAEAEVTFLVDLGPGLAHVLGVTLLVGEVLLDDVVCLHVNLLVGVVLALVDLLHAANLLDEQGVAVDRLATRSVLASLLVHVTDLENVLKTVESDLDNLVVGANQQVAKRLDAAALYKVADLGGLLETT